VKPLEIAGRAVGPGHPCYVVAEVSANHDQSYDRAVAILHAAKDAGADAVKLQTYTPDTLTLDSTQPWFRVTKGPWAGRTLHDLYGEAQTPWEWHAGLQRVAAELGLGFFSTPFDDSAVAFLEKLDVPAYKIASFEIVDIGLLRTVARTGKPVIVSTGMASTAEIQEAVDTLRVRGAGPIALLKCTSAYPADPAEMNLRTIPDLARRFDTVAGLSDHTLGSATAVAAVALGAAIVEKHITLARADGGPDASFSMEPDEFRAMVEEIRIAERALGEVSYVRTESEEQSVGFRRSLFVVEDIGAGELLTERNVRSIRPGGGLAPRHLPEVLGRRARRPLARGTPLTLDALEEEGT
jgi:pseudaminic acid synthase